eukprot:NODE_43_length_3909_cov_45.241152_g41_i0.p1 GENE.NODE_43_length_3909_cov_45.241152_g41_i0~~NODE_43_length_3909_cov_45.241152_g41_i0.p1  ORF type:complete len:555 (+),score=72.77 NODE_43_length_3909_cov_45.241152_g41_i0:132-1796(+)
MAEERMDGRLRRVLTPIGQSYNEAMGYLGDAAGSAYNTLKCMAPQPRFYLLENGAQPPTRQLSSTSSSSDPTSSTAAVAVGPERQPGTLCAECLQQFGITRYRYYCAHCGFPFCKAHLPHKAHVPHLPKPARVCEECRQALEQESYLQRIAWRTARMQAFMDDSLIPFTDDWEDSTASKTIRGLSLIVVAAERLPLQMAIMAPIYATRFLMEHGATTLQSFFLRKEFSQAAGVLREMAGDDVQLHVVDLVGGFYYLMAEQRAWRGNSPDEQAHAHATCPAVSDEDLDYLLTMSPFAMQLAYTDEDTDIQRLAGYLGYQLLFSKTTSELHQPAWAVVGRLEDKSVILLIRGTKSVSDILTDMIADEARVPLDKAELEALMNSYIQPPVPLRRGCTTFEEPLQESACRGAQPVPGSPVSNSCPGGACIAAVSAALASTADSDDEQSTCGSAVSDWDTGEDCHDTVVTPQEQSTSLPSPPASSPVAPPATVDAPSCASIPEQTSPTSSSKSSAQDSGSFEDGKPLGPRASWRKAKREREAVPTSGTPCLRWFDACVA